MKKILIIGIIMLILLTAYPVMSENTKNIDVTLSPSATASIYVNQSAWNPSAGLGEDDATATDWANLDNNGLVQVDVTVNASDTADWTLETSAGHNQFQMQYGTGGGPTPEITFGNFASANTTVSFCSKTAKINETDFIAVYTIGTDPYYPYVRVGRYIGSDITWITPQTQVSNGGDDAPYVDIAMFNSTDFIAVYDQGAAYARVGRITGSTITWLMNEVDFWVMAGLKVRVDTLNETDFVVVMMVGGTDLEMKTGRFTGSGITDLAGPIAVEPTGADNPSVAKLTSTEFVISYKKTQPYVRVADVNGNFKTDAIQVHTNTTTDTDVVAIDADDFLIVYGDTGASNTQTIVGHYTGSNFTWLTDKSVAFPNNALDEYGISLMSSTRFVLVGDQGVSRYVIGDIDGSSITYGSILDENDLYFVAPSISVVSLSDTKLVVSGRHGSGATGSIGGTIPADESWTNIGTSPATFVNNLAYDGSHDFGLQIFMPTTSSTNAVQTSTITFIATVD